MEWVQLVKRYGLGKNGAVSGFTIIELLIVIVIIAILAAISIVAYNGVITKAQQVAQVAALDDIGRAIEEWQAQTGETLDQSGAGAYGNGYGGFTTTSAAQPVYTATSIEALLTNAGDFNPTTFNTSAFSLGSVLIAPCTSSTTNQSWVVLTYVTPAPAQSVADQIAATKCTSPMISLYTGSSYNMNLLKVY